MEIYFYKKNWFCRNITYLIIITINIILREFNYCTLYYFVLVVVFSLMHI